MDASVKYTIADVKIYSVPIAPVELGSFSSNPAETMWEYERGAVVDCYVCGVEILRVYDSEVVERYWRPTEVPVKMTKQAMAQMVKDLIKLVLWYKGKWVRMEFHGKAEFTLSCKIKRVVFETGDVGCIDVWVGTQDEWRQFDNGYLGIATEERAKAMAEQATKAAEVTLRVALGMIGISKMRITMDV